MTQRWMTLVLAPAAVLLVAPATALAGNGDAGEGEAAEQAKETRVDARGRIVMEGDRVRVTGSRIARDADVYAPGRTLHTSTPVTVYERDDLRGTGQPFVQGALKRLDPRIH